MIQDAPLKKILTNSAYFIVRYWLEILTGLAGLAVLLIFIYPLFMATGNPTLQVIASLIHAIYHQTCHQLQDRSLFLEGFPLAVCARVLAIFVSFFLGCVAFAFVRTRLKPWSLGLFILLCLPMAIDGFAQLFGIPIPRAIGPGPTLVATTLSNAGLRIITGGIFGLASALYMLPYLQNIFGDTGKEAAKQPK